MRLFIIISLFCCSFQSIAQSYFLNSPKNKSLFVELYGNYYLGSNSITNSFVKEVFTGAGYISSELKNDIFNKLKTTNNHLGFDSEIGFLLKFKKEKVNYLIGLRNVDLLNLTFNENTLKLLLQGNEPFRGKTISLSPFDFTNITYQCLDIGIEKEQKKTKWFAFISLARGLQYQKSSMTNASLYTAQDGTNIQFSSDIFFTQNPDIPNKITPVNGLGMGISGGFSHFFDEDKKHGFHLMMRDLGFVNYWNLYHYEAKDNYDFSGIEIDDILNLESEFSELKQEEGKSELETILGLEEQKKNVLYFMPTRLQLIYQRPINQKINLQASIQHYVGMYPIPRLNAQIDFSVGKTTALSPLFMYGAWGKFNSGIQLKQQIKKSYFINLQVYYFEYLVAPKQTTGNALNLSIYRNF